MKSRWLLGIVNKEDHKAVVQFIEKRDFINIIPLITRHVEAGCTINTDGAKVYNALNSMNYTHNVVIHKNEFVTATGIHSNWIENFWDNLKMKLKGIRGSQKEMLDAQTDEYLYGYNRINEGSVFQLLINDISRFIQFKSCICYNIFQIHPSNSVQKCTLMCFLIVFKNCYFVNFSIKICLQIVLLLYVFLVKFHFVKMSIYSSQTKNNFFTEIIVKNL